VFAFFTNSESLIDAGIKPLRIATCMVPLIGVQIVTYFYYIALHRAVGGIVVSLCRTVLFITPLIFFLSYLYGMTGVWASFPIADFFAALFCVYIARYVGEDALNGNRYTPRPI
jgi:Na+-driven multidrug efflux pump